MKSLAFALALLPIAAHAQGAFAPSYGILQGIEQAQRLSQPNYGYPPPPRQYGYGWPTPYSYAPNPALQTTTCGWIGRDWVCRAY